MRRKDKVRLPDRGVLLPDGRFSKRKKRRRARRVRRKLDRSTILFEDEDIVSGGGVIVPRTMVPDYVRVYRCTDYHQCVMIQIALRENHSMESWISANSQWEFLEVRPDDAAIARLHISQDRHMKEGLI